MLIANPIYDIVFKRLLENQTIASGLLERILDCEIIDLTLRPQEFTTRRDKDEAAIPITLFRVDFSARIRLKNGEEKNILIEIQKAKLATDILRFRNYLGSQYQMNESGVEGEIETLPITTIYFLNFVLDKMFPKVIHVSREYRDAVKNEAFEGRHDFIEQLTHDAYVIQVPKLDDDHSSDLERVLQIFDQRYIFDDESHLLEFKSSEEITDPLLLEMIRVLEKAVADPELEKFMDLEDEMLVGQKILKKKLESANVVIENERAEKEWERAEKEREKAEKEKERAEKKKEKAEKERLAALLKKHGIDPENQ